MVFVVSDSDLYFTFVKCASFTHFSVCVYVFRRKEIEYEKLHKSVADSEEETQIKQRLTQLDRDINAKRWMNVVFIDVVFVSLIVEITVKGTSCACVELYCLTSWTLISDQVICCIRLRTLMRPVCIPKLAMVNINQFTFLFLASASLSLPKPPSSRSTLQSPQLHFLCIPSCSYCHVLMENVYWLGNVQCLVSMVTAGLLAGVCNVAIVVCWVVWLMCAGNALEWLKSTVTWATLTTLTGWKSPTSTSVLAVTFVSNQYDTIRIRYARRDWHGLKSWVWSA